MNKVVSHIMLALMLFLFSCKSEEQVKAYGVEPNEKGKFEYVNKRFSKKFESVRTVKNDKGLKVKEQINYQVSLISALDYLKRGNKQIDPVDEVELVKEDVLMLTIENSKTFKSIFESARIEMDKDKAMQYFIGDIIKDIILEQGGKELVANGHHFEPNFGKQNEMRLYFFFKGLSKTKPVRVVYNDRLFGSGLINFNINNEDI